MLPKLISDGDQLLTGHRTLARTCIFQQDNAPAHTAVMNKALLNDFLPDRWMQDSESGLACPPDLDWIKDILNVWAWAEHMIEPFV